MKTTDFKKGDEIVITGRPTAWASSLNKNYPLSAKINYPFECTIDDLREEDGFTAISAGNYGWDLSTLVRQEKVKLKVKETMRTISFLDARRIIGVACSTWREKLANKWAVDIVMEREISIQESFYQEMRKACTKEQHEVFDEIFKEAVKVGDWVIGWHHLNETYTDNAWKIEKIDRGFAYPNNGTGHNTDVSNVRLATEDEIKRATCPTKGTPCLVRNNGKGWHLRYADGKGKFFDEGVKNGFYSSEWKEFRILDINDLP